MFQKEMEKEKEMEMEKEKEKEMEMERGQVAPINGGCREIPRSKG